MDIGSYLRILPILWRMHQGKPTFLSFNVTNRCNEACPMCNVWRSGSDELMVADIERILKDLKAFGIAVIEISGGEPFLRTDIFSILELLDRLKLFYTLSSNGTLLSETTIRKLRGAKGMLQLAVSLDSLDRGLYARLRGRDLLPQVLNNIEHLRKSRLKVPVKINFTMSRLNYRETFDILNFARTRGLYLSVFPVNQSAGLHHRHGDSMFSADGEERRQMSRIYKVLAKLRKAGGPLWEYSGFYDLASDYVLGKSPGPCDAGKLFLDLRADGRLAVCVDQPAIADLRRERMMDVQNRITFQGEAIKRCQAESPCCYTCTHNISLTARNMTVFMAETAFVRLLTSVNWRNKDQTEGDEATTSLPDRWRKP